MELCQRIENLIAPVMHNDGYAVVRIQNTGNINTFCLGSYTCNVTSLTAVFLVQIIYIIFWTWVLNLMCNAGASWVAWLLVLLPFIVLFFFYFYEW
jgi:hypothetical protein